MDQDRVNWHIFQWAIDNGCFNSTSVCTDICARHKMDVMLDLNVKKTKGYVRLLEARLMDEFIEMRYVDLNRVNAKCGQGLNKLRTYRTYKCQYVWRNTCIIPLFHLGRGKT